MARRYAQNTEVPADKSRAEIEATLRRYGADQFMYGWKDDSAVIAFRANGRQVKFILPLPDRRDFSRTPGRNLPRSVEQIETAWEQACRQSWRALALVIKAKLEAVAAGITCFEDEFLAHIVLPNGQQVGDWLRPQIAIAYDRGDMPPLLPAPGK